MRKLGESAQNVVKNNDDRQTNRQIILCIIIDFYLFVGKHHQIHSSH